MLDLLTIGATKLNTYIRLPSASLLCERRKTECQLCLAAGEKISVQEFNTQIAGTAPNVAVGVAKLGFKTALMTTVGDDGFLAHAKVFLKKEGVNTKFIKQEAGFRSSAAVVLNYQGESTQLVDLVPHIYRYSGRPRAKFLHVGELGGDYLSLYRDLIKAKGSTRLSLNPGSIQITERSEILFKLISTCEILFLNTTEARTLLKTKASPQKCAEKLYQLGANIAVVTDGLKGAWAYDGEYSHFAPIFPANRYETTGAGDGFTSGVLAGLLANIDLPTCLQWGAINAGSVVTKIGPTKGLLNLDELKRAIKRGQL